MIKQVLRTTMIAAVAAIMAMAVAVDLTAAADTLESLIAGAKNEKNLKVTLQFIDQNHVKKLEAAFNARYGLNVTIDANFSGRYSRKAKNAVKKISEGAAPEFDLMVLNESSYAIMANAGALEKIEGWQNLLPEGADPSVSPGPIAGLGFIAFDFYFGYSYRSDKVGADLIPLSMKDLANASLNGNAAVSMFMSNITYAVLKYSPEELLAIGAAWSQNDVKKYHPRKLAFAVAQGNFFVGGFHTIEQYLSAGSQNGHFKMGLFKDVAPRGVLLHAVPKGSRSPNAAKLFAVWMTGKEALDICGEGTYLGNMLKNGNQKALTIADQLMMRQNLKPVSFFDSQESYQKLVWLGTSEGQNFSKRLGAALTKSQ